MARVFMCRSARVSQPADSSSPHARRPHLAITSRLDFAALLDQRGRILQVETALPALALMSERLVLENSALWPLASG